MTFQKIGEDSIGDDSQHMDIGDEMDVPLHEVDLDTSADPLKGIYDESGSTSDGDYEVQGETDTNERPATIDDVVRSNTCFAIVYWLFMSFFILFALGLTLGLWVTIFEAASPFRATYHKEEVLSEWVTAGTLDNGLEYYILRNPIPKGRFTSYLRVKVGAVSETDSERGLAQ